MPEDTRLTDFAAPDANPNSGDDVPATEPNDAPATEPGAATSAEPDAASTGSDGVSQGSAPEGTDADEPPADTGDRSTPGRERAGPSDSRYSTYAWGVERTCDDCGAVVDRCWRDGDALVCPACKEW